MTRSGVILGVAGVAAGAALAGLGVWWAPSGDAPATPTATATRPAAGPPVPHAAVTFFDPSPNDDTLAPVRQEIPVSPNAAEHGRLVVEAALERATRPAVGLWPPGTTLRTYFVTPTGEVIIDLSGIPADGLGGGTTAERLAVHALVRTVAENIPGAASVRLLVNGQPATTLAAHLDLRTPIAVSLANPQAEPAAPTPPAP